MSPTKLVDTPELLDLCLDDIASPSVSQLAIDLEGIDLSRNGTISLLQILSNLSTSVWVVDVFALGTGAFSHVSPHGQSLGAVLENPHTVKVRTRILIRIGSIGTDASLP
jgi:exonuclease 3'-5' domain-containing protein 1